MRKDKPFAEWLLSELDKLGYKATLKSHLTSAQGALEKYGTHKQYCSCSFRGLTPRFGDKDTCNCGLMKALATLKAKLSGGIF